MRRVIRLPNGTSQELIKKPSYHERLVQDLGFAPSPLRYPDVPTDLRPHLVQEYGARGETGYGAPGGSNWEMRTALAVEHIAKTTVLSKGLLGRPVTVGTSQVSVAIAERLKGYLFLNPTASVGLTTSVTAQASTTVSGSGNTQASPIGVATFREIHVFVDLTDTDSGTTTFSLYQQAQDPLSGNWADTQLILSTATTGTYYITPAAIGVATDLAFRWELSGGSPSATFSIAVVLKDGLAGSSQSGLANIIYLGPNGVSTTSGFPLLEGQQQSFYLKENLELFAIAAAAGLTLRVFEL